MLASIYNTFNPKSTKPNLSKYKGMASIYKLKQGGQIAFGRAPRNNSEIDFINMEYQAKLVVD